MPGGAFYLSFLGRPPFFPFLREASAFFLLLIDPSATAAGFFIYWLI